MIKVSIDKSSLNHLNTTAALMQKYLGMTQREIVQQNTKLIAEDMTNRTPPYVVKQGANPSTNLAGKKAGEDRIKIDILKIIKPVQDVFKKSTDDQIQKAVRRRNSEAVTKILSGLKDIKNPKVMPFDESIHTQYRGNNKKYSPPSRLNNFTFDRSKVMNYVKKVQDRVGLQKSGFHLAAVAFGAKPIAWLSKHFPYTKGFFVEINNGSDYSITVVNRAKGLHRHYPEYSKGIALLAERMRKNFHARFNYLMKQGKIDPNASI